MKHIDSEIILQRKIGPLVYVYMMTITVIMLSLIILSILCCYKTYYTIKGVITNENNHYYIKTYVPVDYIKYIINNKIVRVDDEDYQYKIISIDSEYFTDNITTYQIIKIEVNLKEKYKFNNLTVDLKFLRENKRIIDYIIK